MLLGRFFTGFEFEYVQSAEVITNCVDMSYPEASLSFEQKLSGNVPSSGKITVALEKDIDFLQKSEELSDQFFKDTLNHILNSVSKLWMGADEADIS